MKKNTPNLTLLRKRIAQNYEDYKEELEGFDVDYYFLVADDMAAVEDVHSTVMICDYITESDAAFLLTFDNPLVELAEEWKNYTAENGAYDFSGFLCEFIADNGGGDTSQHGLIGEIKSKYGKDIPLETACLLELVEIGRKLFRMSDPDKTGSAADISDGGIG